MRSPRPVSLLALLATLSACSTESDKPTETGCADGAVPTDWHADADGDGYGDPENIQSACTRPEGYVGNNLDCDDSSVKFHPGAAETDCTDPNDYNCDGSVGYADADGDGAPACRDCDDLDATRSPDEDEVCDGLDNDCNGVVDYPAIDAPTWSIDYDGDGYGREDTSFQIEACQAPDGFVDNADDCDDADANDFPGAYDVYVDADGDGFGADGETVSVCELEEGTTTEAGDCDDADGEINPGALEICNDGIDQDCGASTSCELGLGNAAASIQGDTAEAFLGTELVGVGDVTGDGIDDLLVGAPEAEGSGGAAGEAWLFAGPISGSGLSADDAHMRFLGVSSGDAAGRELAQLGDIDGDGVDDLAIAAPTASDRAVRAGSVYLFTGDTISGGTAGDVVDLSTADHTWTGPTAYDFYGTNVVGTGDVDGDGIADMLIGSSAATTAGQGGVFLILGSETIADSATTTANASAQAFLQVEQSNAYGGDAIAGLGDLDGDGNADFGVGLHQASTDGVELTGKAFLFTSLPTGTVGLSTADAVLEQGDANDRLGTLVLAAGDLDGDGYDDAFIGAPRDDTNGLDSGSLWGLPGSADISALGAADLDAVSLVILRGAESNDGVGSIAATGSDWDEDGAMDVLIGRPGDGGDSQGAAFLISTAGVAASPGMVLTTEDASAVMIGEAVGDGAGSTVAFVGDVLGLGTGSVLAIGAYEADPDGINEAGRAYLVGSIAD